MTNKKLIAKVYFSCGVLSIVLLGLAFIFFTGYTLLINLLIPSSVISFFSSMKYLRGFKLFKSDRIDAILSLLVLTLIPFIFFILTKKNYLEIQGGVSFYISVVLLFLVAFLTAYFLWFKKILL